MIVDSPYETEAVKSGTVKLPPQSATVSAHTEAIVLPGDTHTLTGTAGGNNAPGDHFKSDVGYSDMFVHRFGDSIRFCADEGVWLVFDEAKGWQRDTAQAIRAKAADYARELRLWALERAKSLPPDEGMKLVASMVCLGNSKRIEPALKFAQSNPATTIQAIQLDAEPFLVGARNGVIDLRDGSFQPHSPRHLVTRRLGTDYIPGATAPTWERFLADVQPEPEMRAFLQRLAGYALTGEVREHILPFHYGTGANGKGTYLEHALLKLSGDYGAKLTDSLVYKSQKGHQPHREIANLCGKRFALGEENSEGGKLNESLLKAMTGGDKVKGRFHYANFVEYFPTYKIALVGNHRPRIDGTDDGIWRRFLLIDWPVQIPTEKRDGQLKDKLAAEMPGILNWAAAGARDWMQGGLRPPKCCTSATEAYRAQSDKLAEFIADYFVQEEGATVTKAVAYDAYREWAREAGIDHPASKRFLGFQLAGRGWQETKAGHERQHYWVNYRLRGGNIATQDRYADV